MVGIIAVTVAFQQYQVSKNKLKLDLFERCLAFYAAAQKLLSIVFHKANITLDELREFRASINEASFFFDTELTQYLDEIDRHALSLHTKTQNLDPLPVGPERERVVQDRSDEIAWLSGQYSEIKVKFSPYLSFAEWK